MLYPNSKDNLSLEEKGILSLMLNLPEADYCTIEDLSKYCNNNPLSIQTTLLGLKDKGFVFFNKGKYAINKMKIPEMIVVR